MSLPVINGSNDAWGPTLNDFLGGAAGDGTPTIPTNRVPYMSGANLTSSANLTFDGTTLTVNALVLTAGNDIRPTVNSTTAINIAQADGTDFVIFDTTNRRVGIGPGATAPAAPVNVFRNSDGQMLRLTRVTIGEWAFVLNSTAQLTGVRSGSLELIPLNGNTDFAIGNTADAVVFMAKTDGVAKIAGTATRATTEGTNHLDIFDGTAPVGTLSAGISLYSTSGELRVMDSAGNPTLLSPHGKDGYWIFESRSGKTGKMFRVHMERLVRMLNKKYGNRFIEELGKVQ